MVNRRGMRRVKRSWREAGIYREVILETLHAGKRPVPFEREYAG
jgi:hypothetical protein